MSNRLVMTSVCLCLIVFANASMFAQQERLPGESDIPGQKPSVDLPSDLPSELVVPNRPDLRALPSEATVPDQVIDQVTGESDPEQQEPEPMLDAADRPWLTLNARGPTAPVRAIAFSADGQRLMAGGQDKRLHVWQFRDDPPAGQSPWIYERSIYWQVQRGQRGTILSIACNPRNIAFAGIGASALTGEIALADARTLGFSTALFELESGHRAAIQSVAMPTAEGSMASTDAEGRAILWRRDQDTGRWNPEIIRAGDFDQFEKDIANQLFGWRSRGNAVALSSQGVVIYPELANGFQPGGVPRWQLMRRSPNGDTAQQLRAEVTHGGTVTALDCSDDGNRIVSADLTDQGRLFVWDLSQRPLARTFQLGAPIRCLDISADGSTLVIGTARSESDSAGVAVWSWNAANQLRPAHEWKEDVDVYACCLDHSNQRIAYSRGATVVVRPLAAESTEAATVLEAELNVANRVTFSSGEDRHLIRLQTNDASDAVDWVFDPQRLRMQQLDQHAEETWIDPDPRPSQWRLTQVMEDNRPGWRIAMGDEITPLPLEADRDGNLTSHAWIPSSDDETRPAALIVGTSGRNHVFVFRINAQWQCELLREYRGHAAAVTSVGYSADRRYLVSSSLDGTVRLWKLDRAIDVAPNDLVNRWGASLEIDGGDLVVSDIVNDGPLYFRGVRSGDQLMQLGWVTADGTEEMEFTADATEILNKLESATSYTLFQFRFRRDATEQPHFYLYPAWQPLASLVWSRQREWAYWSPYGYYDASFNGHKLFGWQVNQGIDQAPEVFRAAELKNDLERPELMQNLLSQSNLADAFRSVQATVPADLSDRLGANHRLKPTISITTPQSRALAVRGEVTVQAELSWPTGVELGSANAYANAVPAVATDRGKIVERDGRQYQSITWQVALPSDRHIRIQVLATTALGHAGTAQVDIENEAPAPSRQPRLFLLGAGINQYFDSQIPSLDFAVNNVEALTKLLRESQEVFRSVNPVSLTNANVSRSLWTVTSESLAEQMREVATPDDLLVIFLSGHGFRDPISQRYYYLTADSRYSDVLGRRYADCISFDEFAAFANLPCRKLVVLDTCHSGAVQALRQQDLKTVVRTLENDLVLTLTASEGASEAFESGERQLGIFTARLIDGLGGEADANAVGGNEDGVISLHELVAYLKATVPADAARSGNYQFPTASPADLIEVIDLSLTATKSTPTP